MLPEKGKICLLAALLLVAQPAAVPARAQTEPPPAVEIDISVLDDYGGRAPMPEIPDDGSYPRLLSLQPLRSMIPSLTGPGKRLEKPFPAPKETIENMVAFPVEVKEKRNRYAGKFGKTPPVPGRKPAVAPAAGKTLAAAAETGAPAAGRAVPIPPRRPAIQRASPEFVREARKIHAQNLDKSGMEMPAVPALAVQEEVLPPPPVFKVDARDDPLGRSLVTPDRKAMVKSVESVAARSAALSAGAGKAKAVSAIEPAAGLRRTAAFDITENPQGYVPRRPPAEKTAEEKYVSMPFSPAPAETDEKVLAALDTDILPIMKQNPRWRLQIQAFAGPAAKSGTEIDARRISLSRALSVREYLLKNGIDASRMDVRALGMQTDRTPADRVDFLFFDPETSE